jgi:RNA polymerase sigma-32 factor
MKRGGSPSSAADALELYLAEVDRHPLLSPEDEQALARAYREKGDLGAAHALVTANLRFVVKVAHNYKSRGINMTDLIQEGNIGLIKAVERFDPDKGVRLISYAVWWIRAYIQDHLLRSYSIVRLGTTLAQRRLFFSLARTRRELVAERKLGQHDGGVSQIAETLCVKQAEVESMAIRMSARDVSLDAPLCDDDGASTRLDLLPCEGPSQDQELAVAQANVVVQSQVNTALARLSARERYILEQRVMSDEPMTLTELGEHFGISRERARQVEMRTKQKLRDELVALARRPRPPSRPSWPPAPYSLGERDGASDDRDVNSPLSS